MEDEVTHKVKAIIEEHLGVNLQDINMNSNLVEDFGADSLDEVEIVMVLEEEFDKEIPDSDAEKLKTVQGIVDYINGLKR